MAKTGVVLVLWGKSNGFHNLGYRTSGFVVQRGNSDLTRVQGQSGLFSYQSPVRLLMRAIVSAGVRNLGKAGPKLDSISVSN